MTKFTSSADARCARSVIIIFSFYLNTHAFAIDFRHVFDFRNDT